MKAVILCGGQGSRIRDASELLPKPLLPIGGYPILWHIMKIYAAYGVTEFVICLGYKGWLIKEFFLNYATTMSDFTMTLGTTPNFEYHGGLHEDGWKVTLVDTGEHAMTGARIRKIRRYVEDEEHFCVTYGDGVANVNVERLVDQHVSSGLIATLTGVRIKGRFGELRLSGDRVEEFAEKPIESAGRISGGFMVFDAQRIWEYLQGDDHVVLEQNPIDRLVEDRQLGCYSHSGYWQCMDTLREYNHLNTLWDEGNAPWKIW